MKKLFISQPMRGLTDKQILEKRAQILGKVKNIIPGDIELIDSFIEDYPGETEKHIPVWYLGESLKFLSQADIVFFGEGWKDARGCKIEHEVAVAYDLNIIEEEDCNEE